VKKEEKLKLDLKKKRRRSFLLTAIKEASAIEHES